MFVGSTLRTRPSQTISNATTVPAQTRNQPVISRFGFSLMPSIPSACAVTVHLTIQMKAGAHTTTTITADPCPMISATPLPRPS